jgi:RHS repeat-associated protein
MTEEDIEEETEDVIEEEEEIELEWRLIYDNNWNLIWNLLNNKRQYIYSYDYKNRLVKIEKNIYKKVNWSETNEIEQITKIVEIKYDILDRRISKIFNNWSYIKYYYSNNDIILEENYTKKDKLKNSKEFVYGLQTDDIISMKSIENKTRKIEEEYVNKKWVTKTRKIKEEYIETKMYYYSKNHLWSIVAITDENNKIVEEYVYDVFGKPYSKQEDWKITNLKKSPIWNTRLYTGREYDRGLKLYYNRARYYNPELGRFISRDPIDISDDVNLYSYVGNNGVMFVDRMGLSKDSIVWNLDSIRIIYEDSWIWHTHLQIWKNVYTYWAEWGFIESRLKGVWSLIPNLFDAEITNRNIEEFLLFKKDLIIYDLSYTDTQKDLLNWFVNNSISWNSTYSLLWQNCASFVQAWLVASWIDVNFEEWFWLNVPYVYNWYLNELSKWNYNYINDVYNYNIWEYSSEEVNSIINTIENNYNSSVDYLLNISPYVK